MHSYSHSFTRCVIYSCSPISVHNFSVKDIVTPLNFRSKALELGFVLKKASFPPLPSLRLAAGPRPQQSAQSEVPSGRVANVVRHWPRPGSGSDDAAGSEAAVVDLDPVETDTSYALVSEMEGGEQTTDGEWARPGRPGVKRRRVAVSSGTQSSASAASDFEFIRHQGDWPPESPPVTPRLNWTPEL